MDSKLKVVVDCKEGVSFAKSIFVTPPFRVVSTAMLREDGWEQLMIMSSSPGMLSGDNYQIDIELKEGSRLELESQSYQRIYNMEGEARQNCNITIGNNSIFSYIPHPIVPHKESRYNSTTYVELGENSSFLQGEIITCGRKYFGEMFLFDHFHTTTRVNFKGKTLLFDNILFEPKTMDISSIGVLEGYSHQATLLFATTKKIEIKELIEEIFTLSEECKKNEELLFGISLAQTTGFVVRALANSGETLFSLFKTIQKLVYKSTDNK